MVFRTAGAIAALLIGLGASGGEALAQYYPPPQAYPPQAYPPQAYPPPQGYRPPVADADDNQLYDLQGRPLPPGTVPQATAPAAPAPRYGNASPVYPDEAGLPPPPRIFPGSNSFAVSRQLIPRMWLSPSPWTLLHKPCSTSIRCLNGSSGDMISLSLKSLPVSSGQ